MTTYTCPDGHASSTGDYCDVCGMPVPAGQAQGTPAGPPVGGPGTYASPVPPVVSPGLPPQPSMMGGGSSLDLDVPVPPPLPHERVCPNCGAPNLPDALYCEDCGYDFTTGQLPRPLDPPAATPAPRPVPAAVPSGAPAGVVPSGILPPLDPPGPGPVPASVPPADTGAVPLPPPGLDAPDVVAPAPVTPLDPPGGPDAADPDGADQRGADQRGADQRGADQRGADQRGADANSVAAPNVPADAAGSSGDPGAGGGPLLAPPLTPTSAPGHVEWVAEVWVDPDWYAAQDVSDPCPSAGMPWVVPILERTVLIGRVSASRNIHPQIEVSTDNGVSRRHAQLSSDGQRWWVEDLQSANGTYVGAAGAPLPATPILPGQRIELAEDDRIYLGAWSRVVVRRATPEESTLGS